MTSTTRRETIASGDELLIREWMQPDAPRGSVLIAHGIGEHSGRYEHVGDYLVSRGYAVSSFDQRGFGGSTGRRAYVEQFDHYLDDVADQLEHLPNPTILLGHSLGGLMALAYTLSPRPSPDLLVLSAPALDANVDPIRRGLAKVLGRFAPKVEIPNSIKGHQLSSDPTVGEAYFNDPLVHTKTTTRLGMEILRVMDETQARLSQLDVPTLVIHGSMDSVVSPAFSAPLAELPTVERVLLPGFAHECFNDVEKDKALATVADWLDAQTSSAA